MSQPRSKRACDDGEIQDTTTEAALVQHALPQPRRTEPLSAGDAGIVEPVCEVGEAAAAAEAVSADPVSSAPHVQAPSGDAAEIAKPKKDSVLLHWVTEEGGDCPYDLEITVDNIRKLAAAYVFPDVVEAGLDVGFENPPFPLYHDGDDPLEWFEKISWSFDYLFYRGKKTKRSQLYVALFTVHGQNGAIKQTYTPVGNIIRVIKNVTWQ
jgi:hypothetical protein